MPASVILLVEIFPCFCHPHMMANMAAVWPKHPKYDLFNAARAAQISCNNDGSVKPGTTSYAKY